MSLASKSAIVCSLLCVQVSAQTILYVDQNATGPAHDGWTWCTAFTDLQDALDLANFNVVIKVAAGSYTPDRGTGSRNGTFRLENDIAIEGGYAGCGFPNPEDRDYQTYETILNGDIDNTVNDFDGNSFHVVTGSNTNSTAILEGFTIKYGYAHSGASEGGGVFIVSGSPTISNCTIESNSAHLYGGGVYVRNGSPTIWNCTIKLNKVNSQGGGLYKDGNVDISISDCIFESNSAINGGGGLFATGGDLDITDCTFFDNSGGSGGGASISSVNTHILRSEFVSNSTRGSNGGGLSIGTGNVTIDTCVFHSNSAATGGGIISSSGTVAVNGCTIVNNTANSGQGVSGGTFNISSSILWNGPSEIGGGSINIDYSNVLGGWPGTDNIFAQPMFVDSLNDDYRLTSASPCVDTGDPDFPSSILKDLDGNDRVLDGNDDGEAIVDMGAYEFTGSCSGPDFDDDGMPDHCDSDIDDDGVANTSDVCNFTTLGAEVDSQGRPLGDIDGSCHTDLFDYAILQLGLTGP